MRNVAAMLAVLTFFVSSAAFAAAGWGTAAVTVTSIEVDGSSGGTMTFVRFATDPVVSGNPCGAWSTTKDYLLGGTAENVKALTSLVTAALLSNKPVKVWLAGTCTTVGTTGYATASNLMLLK